MKVLLFYLLTGFAASCGQQGPLYLPDGTDGNAQADHRSVDVLTAVRFP